MSAEIRALLAALAAAGVTALLLPVMARLAWRVGIVDHPGGYKQHERATPYLGGVAILAGVLVAVFATAKLRSPVPTVLACAVAICALGTLDDRRPIPPVVRAALHGAIGAILWVADAGWQLDVPDWVNLVLTVGWVVLATNALNMIDNLDGAAAAAAAASALGIAAIALSEAPDAWPALLAAAVAGGCLGFLPFNLARPSRVFLGDGGSTLLGFLVAVATMGALAGSPGFADLVAAALFVGMAVFDTAVTFGSRLRRGISALTGGRDHVTHWILGRVGSARTTALVIGGVQACLSGLAVAVIELGLPGIPVAAAVLVLVGIPAAIAVGRRGHPSSPAPLPPVERAG